MFTSTGVAIGVLVVLAREASASCAYGTTLNPRAAGEVKIGNFAYSGVNGPTNWLSIDAANVACATGTRQSPIDMVDGAFTLLQGTDINLTINDMENGTEFENLGTTVEVIAEGGAMTVPNVGDFILQQFHFHLPSEHLDNGTSMAMEMHTVWEGADGAISVLAAYIDLANEAATAAVTVRDARRLGRTKHRIRQTTNDTSNSNPTKLLETVLNSVTEISEPGTSTRTGPLAMSEIVNILTAGQFQSYTGSLTTPPCTEGVNWLVATERLSIRPETFSKVRDVLGFNSRFPQNTLGGTNVLQLNTQASASLAGLGSASMSRLIQKLFGQQPTSSIVVKLDT